MAARDLVYGRRGGGWRDNGAAPETARACAVCGGPMLGGQQRRHGVCSPLLACCGHHEDLVGDLARHVKQHAEVDARA